MNIDTNSLSNFKSWFSDRNINAILADFDDTFVYTTKVYKDRIDSFVTEVHGKYLPDQDFAGVKTSFTNVNSRFHSKVGVGRNRWDPVVEDFIVEMGQSQNRDAIMAISQVELQKIYTDIPEVYPGSVEFLEYVKKAEIPICLVTHAEEARAYYKLDKTNLRKYFDFVCISDPSTPKSSEDWVQGANKLNEVTHIEIKIHDCLIMGDNVKGDIQAAIQAGADPKKCILLPSAWEVYREGEVPEGIILANSIEELLMEMVNPLLIDNLV